MKALETFKRYLSVGTLGISLMLHLAIFLAVGSVIIIHAVAPKIIPVGDPTPVPAVEPPPPDDTTDPQPPSDAESSQDNPGGSSQAAFNVDQITSVNAVSPAFTVIQTVGLPENQTGIPGVRNGRGGGGNGGGGGRVMANPFGGVNARAEDGALVGTMYDLKQTAERKASEFSGNDSNDRFHNFLKDFVNNGWNPARLDGFYKVDRSMGLYQIFIPTMKADEAPRAFNAKGVQPKRWIIIYRGAFSAPMTGTFRFAGLCDDILVVRLNGKNVADGSLFKVADGVAREDLGLAYEGADENHHIRAGNWFDLQEGLTYRLEIMIGEQPGGLFNAFLLIQQKDKDYATRGHDLSPVLPVFQLAPVSLPSGEEPRTPAANFITIQE